MKKKHITDLLLYLILVMVALILGYPIMWLICSSFKDSASIFSSIGLFPKHFTLEGYVEGWKNTSQYPFSLYLNNSLRLVLVTVVLTCVSSCLVSYGFSRFDFPLKKMWFGVMISTMMLPNTIVMIPRYILFKDLNVLNSFTPFYMIAVFAANPFFTYLLIQFMRGIPIELDESARIDGCTRSKTLVKIILPLAKTPLISVALFQSMWTWNDFLNPLLYIDSTKLYPVALGLRLAIDSDTAVNWSKIIAMTVISMMPLILMFLCLQRYFVAGIATSGLKG